MLSNTDELMMVIILFQEMSPVERLRDMNRKGG